MTQSYYHQNAEILLVEDNPLDVELTLHALEDHHKSNKIHIAHDGVEALDFIFGTGTNFEQVIAFPKVILLDLKLPRINGIEVLEKLKSNPKTQAIPVVVLTSSTQDQDISRCYELGVNSYIVKPVDYEQFTIAIRHIQLYWVRLNKQLNFF